MVSRNLVIVLGAVLFPLVLLSSNGFARVHGREVLLFQNIPTVVTASRQAVTVLESPATASIISRQDILHSGFNNVSQLLRYVAGVDFFQSTEASINMLKNLRQMTGYSQ